MLAEELVRLEVGESIGEETVRKALKKRMETVATGNVVHSEAAKPPFRGRHGAGAQGIPAAVRPAASGGVHRRDEQAELVAEVREKLPVRPGSPEQYDDAHYLRRGACTVWMFGEPLLSSWRTVAVTKRRTTLDWAKQVRALANLPRYRDAETITLVWTT